MGDFLSFLNNENRAKGPVFGLKHALWNTRGLFGHQFEGKS